jgi:virginiamycin B lyase
VWVAGSTNNEIDRIGPNAGSVKRFALKTENAHPFRIVAAPSGDIWFTEFFGNRIGRISASGQVTEFAVRVAGPVGITTDPAGSVWFTEETGDAIGRMSPSGAVTEYRLPPRTGPEGITVGPDDAVWFSEFTADRIGRMTIPSCGAPGIGSTCP